MGNEERRDMGVRRMDSSGVVSDLAILGNMTKPEIPITRRIAIGKKDSKAQKTGDGKGTWRRPIKLDHFLCTFTELDETGDFVPDWKFHRDIIKNEKPREIPVTLLFDRLGLNFMEYLALYASRVPWCKGNGIEASRLVKEGTMERKTVDCPCDFLKQGKCKPHIRMLVKLPGMGTGEAAAFRSTGKNTIKAIKGSLAIIKEKVAYILGLPFDAAPLVGLPLKMIYSKKSVADKEGKQRTIPVVHFRCELSEEEIRDLMKGRQQFLKATADFIRGLSQEAPEQYRLEMAKEKAQEAEILRPEDAKEARAIQEEFHPDESIPKEKSDDLTALDAAAKRHATKVETALEAAGAPDDEDEAPPDAPPTGEKAEPPKQKGPDHEESFL